MNRMPTPATNGQQATSLQQGFAIPAVLTVIALGVAMVTEVRTNATVDGLGAANYRDQMRASFLARSALNIGDVIIRLQGRFDNVKELADMGIRITDFAGLFMDIFGGDPATRIGAIGFADAKGLGADDGTFGATIVAEDSKLNVNCAAGSNRDAAKAIYTALLSQYFDLVYNPVFEAADGEGWNRTRERQTDAIFDYIDKDSFEWSQPGNAESYGYQSLPDAYEPKNNYLDTIGEIRLARGVDARFWTLFGHLFTVYGDCKINLRSQLSAEMIRTLITISAKNQDDPILRDPMRLYALAQFVVKAREFGVSTATVQEFADLVKSPKDALGGLVDASGAGGTSATGAPTPSFVPEAGIELDLTKLGQIAVSGPTRVYRITAFGTVLRGYREPTPAEAIAQAAARQEAAEQAVAGGEDPRRAAMQVAAAQQPDAFLGPIKRTITAVWDTKFVPQNSRNTEAGNGAFVYLLEQ